MMARAWLILVVLLLALPAHADRIHLKNGDYVDVDAWTERSGQIVYQRFGGEIAIDKSEVVRIERKATDPTSWQAPGSSKNSSDSTAVDLSNTPPSVLAELSRLQGLASSTAGELAKAELERAKYVSALVKNGSSLANANQSAARIYDARIAELRHVADDANRRYLDFESQTRAQHGKLPTAKGQTAPKP